MNQSKNIKPLLIMVIIVLLMGASYYLGKSGKSASSHPLNSTTNQKSLWTCSMHPQVIQDEPGICPICHMELVPLKQGGVKSEQIQIDPMIVQNMGLRTETITKGPLVRSVRVVGYLEEPEPFHRDINLRVNGWIEKLYADTDGMVVTKGMPLFDLYSPELSIAIDELISARKQSATDATAKSLFESSRRKLIQYGLDESQVDSLAQLETAPRNVPILAGIDGHLTAKMVYQGSAVKSGELVMRLASRHRMWIDAQVYEQQMQLISNGQPARITMVSLPGKVIEGKVLFVHPHVDPQTRTALARIEIPNEDMSLRQGMYATVEILADNYVEKTVVPREAVIDTGRKQIAFVSLGDGKFEPRELQVGESGQNGSVEVVSGLQPGEKVVTSGQFLLDSESRVREAIAKFSDKSTSNGSKDSVSDKSAATTQKLSTITIPHEDELLNVYLAISQKLGEREPETGGASIDLTALQNVIDMAIMHADESSKPMLVRLQKAAGDMQGQSLTDQRKAFMELSNAMIEIVKASAPEKTIFRIHCPMAFHEHGADWLQTVDDVITNPYYAREMKACGSPEETIQGRKP